MKRTGSRISSLNAILIIGMQFLTIIAGFIIPTYIIINYGSEVNGLLNSINQILSYLLLVQMGLSSAVTFALYKPLAQKDYQQISRVLSAANSFYKKSGLLFVILGFFVIVIYPKLINNISVTDIEVSLLIIIMLIPNLLEFFIIGKYRMLLIADFKTYILSIVSILGIIINLVIIYLFSDIVTIIILRTLLLIQSIATCFLILWYVKSKYPSIKFNTRFDNNILNKRWSAFIIQVISVFQQTFPIIFVSISISLEFASMYAIYSMIIFGIVNIIGLINNSYIAVFGEVIALEDKKLLSVKFNRFTMIYYFFCSVVFSILIITFIPFIKIYSSNFNDSNYINKILAILMISESIIAALRAPLGMLINASGLYREVIKPTLYQAAILITLGIILGIYWGIYGLLIASITAHLYRNFEMIIFVRKNIFKFDRLKFLLQQSIQVLSVAILFIISTRMNHSIGSYYSWLLYATIVGSITLFLNIIIWAIFEKTYTFLKIE